MVCNYCLTETNVTNSRFNKKSNKTWRRRNCTKCNSVFTTYESYDLSKIFNVVKYDGSIQNFMLAKLMFSIGNCLDHRPNQFLEIEDLTSNIIAKIIKVKRQDQITTKDIFEFVKQTLKRYDNIAYLKYISKHHQYLR